MDNSDEVYIEVSHLDFRKTCLELHKRLNSPVMSYFAVDDRKEKKAFSIYCVFLDTEQNRWVLVKMEIPEDEPKIDSISKDIFSASLFEREMKEMFGLEPAGNPDLRRLNLHDEVWPHGFYPLRKDFIPPSRAEKAKGDYQFKKVEGDGVFEVPVGPVHAGIIGPGHFRFSAAGEPIINLEARLGFTHRGVEKLFEGRGALEVAPFSECVSGDSAFAHSAAFCYAVEKIYGVKIPERARILRAIFLELERMSNHVNDIGGIAIDVGFSFPSSLASIIKEGILSLNENLSASRYLKGINRIGGVSKDLDELKKKILLDSLENILKDFRELKKMLYSSVSFMDRADRTGILRKKTAVDLGIVGLAARASGIAIDLRKIFPGVYAGVKFNLIKQEEGDVLARLNLRLFEFEESARLVKEFLNNLKRAEGQIALKEDIEPESGFGMGYVEAWRGPVLYWVKIDKNGHIDRCKIVDPSFHNWQGLCFAVLGNIIPDFPLCNKSFDLSYSGNDL